MSRCRRLSRQPFFMKSLASQSSSSGWLGFSPSLPKSPGVSTRPRPKWCSQKRLTSTRPVSGCVPSVRRLAKASRRPVEGRLPSFSGIGFLFSATTLRSAGFTAALGWPWSPRKKRCVTGTLPACSVSARMNGSSGLVARTSAAFLAMASSTALVRLSRKYWICPSSFLSASALSASLLSVSFLLSSLSLAISSLNSRS